tara:strand:+ start:145 stop:411 length:267 start_codon:yes stop_codon:yes gene_type:complete
MENEKITSYEHLCDELFASLYQKFQAQIDWWIDDHIEDYEGDDFDDYKKMIEKFREDLTPESLFADSFNIKEKGATLEPFIDEEKKEK